MSFLQIIDPRKKIAPLQNKNSLAIGIDFGTTNSVIYLTDKDGKRTSCFEEYKNEEDETIRSDLIPTVLAIGKNGEMVAGGASLFKKGDDWVIIKSVKRLLSACMEKVDLKHVNSNLEFTALPETIPEIKIFGHNYGLNEIISAIIAYLKSLAEKQFNEQIEKCVITVPAYFDDLSRNIIKGAAENVGFTVMRVINEPTAAALAYGLDNNSEGIYCIYDFGGGTFDVSLLRMANGVFHIISVVGDSMLGGEDIDNILQRQISEALDQANGVAITNIANIITEIKHGFSFKDRMSEVIGYKKNSGENINFSLNISEYNELIKPLIDKTVKMLRECFKIAALEEPLQGIILVGGSSRIPLIKSVLKKEFSVKIWDNLDADRIVAMGAADKAADLNYGNSDLTLVDVTPLSLGIETMGGAVEKLISRNTSIPVSVMQEFVTFKNNQTGFDIHILQGEREMAKDCRSLGRFQIKGLKPGLAGSVSLQVVFKIDVDGILTVNAYENSENGQVYSMEVKPTYHLNDIEIKKMIEKSIHHAGEDMNERFHNENIVAAERMLAELKNALNDINILSPEKIKSINGAMDDLKNKLAGNNIEEIILAKQLLQPLVDEFAEKRIIHYLSLCAKNDEKID